MRAPHSFLKRRTFQKTSSRRSQIVPRSFFYVLQNYDEMEIAESKVALATSADTGGTEVAPTSTAELDRVNDRVEIIRRAQGPPAPFT